jgi:hypothetical protein
MKVILVIITFGLIALTINLLGYPEQTLKVVYLVAFSVIFGAFSGMLAEEKGFYIRNHRMIEEEKNESH